MAQCPSDMAENNRLKAVAVFSDTTNLEHQPGVEGCGKSDRLLATKNWNRQIGRSFFCLMIFSKKSS